MKTKIVYLLPGGLYNSGGMERVTTIKANYLAEKAGYDVSIITTEQMGRPVFYPLSDKVSLHHLDIGIHEKFGKESYLRKCISRYRKTRKYKITLNRLLCRIRPDITISTLGLDMGFLHELTDGSIKIGELHFPGNFRQLMARKLHKGFIPNYIALIRTQNLFKQCRRLARLVVLTEEERLCWNDKHNIVVIPNPLSFFPEQTSACSSKKAIAVGRLAYEKGFDQLIEAWKTVLEKHPDWKLSIYGGGEQKELLLALIDQYKLNAVIQIHDPVKDIHARFLEHSLMLFPSRYLEALPMVLLEAMSCGLPIVAFDAPCGPKDIITGGKNGFLVESENIPALSGRICFMIESDKLRKSMGQTAREMSIDYGEEKIMSQWIYLFDQLKKER